MSAYESWSLTVSVIGFLLTFGAVYVAYGQLKKMAESVEVAVEGNSISVLHAVLAIEDMISANRVRFKEASLVILQLKSEVKRNANVMEPEIEEKFKTAELSFNEARESYLNAFDRLCACILRGVIPEDEYKKDYRGGINDIVQQHGDLLGVGTRFRNIEKLHDKWADE